MNNEASMKIKRKKSRNAILVAIMFIVSSVLAMVVIIPTVASDNTPTHYYEEDLSLIAGAGAQQHIVFDPTGSYIALNFDSAGDRDTYIFGVENRTNFGNLTASSDYDKGIDISDCGTYIYTGSYDDYFHLYWANNFTEKTKIQPSSPESANEARDVSAWTYNGTQYLLARWEGGGGDSYVVLYNVSGGTFNNITQYGANGGNPQVYLNNAEAHSKTGKYYCVINNTDETLGIYYTENQTLYNTITCVSDVSSTTNAWCWNDSAMAVFNITGSSLHVVDIDNNKVIWENTTALDQGATKIASSFGDYFLVTEDVDDDYYLFRWSWSNGTAAYIYDNDEDDPKSAHFSDSCDRFCVTVKDGGDVYVNVFNLSFDNLVGAGSPPINSNPSPADGAVNQDLNPYLNITLNDPNGNTMNQTFWTNATGSWTQIGWHNNTGNASVENTTSVFSSYNTKYWWSSNVTDGHGNWDNDTYYFTTKGATTIDPTGYLYGNWSFSEHLDAADTLDEDWLFNNDTYWQNADLSDWWSGNWSMHYNNTNGTAPEIGFAILNNSGMNKSQTLAWTKYNLTDSENQNVIYNGVIYAARTTNDWDCALYGFNELYLLTYNGTGFVNTNDSTPVTDETEAYNYWQASWGWYDGDYYYEPDPQNHGSWIKTVYNSLCGRLLTKMYGDETTCTGFLTEPAGWTLNMEDATNFSNQTAQGFGIVTWNPDDYNYSAYFDMVEVWQLNYTRNFSAPFEPDGNGTYGRPHMDFPVLDMAEVLTDIEQFLNDTVEGNLSLDDISNYLKDNVTNLMNMEARIFEPDKAGLYDQNDSVYYYACMFTNFTLFNNSMDNNQLYISIMDCTDGQNNTYLDSAGVGIDVDNNYTWDNNDRFYFWDDSGTNWQWNGSAWSTVFTPSANAFETDQYTWRNLHRYNSHMQYAILIPQSDLIKDDGSEINATDIFGLSIFTHNLDDSNICFWQNKNETNCNPFYSEVVETCKEYFINETGLSSEEVLNINTTNLYRWGEGEIGAGVLSSAPAPIFTNQNPANESLLIDSTTGEVSVTITSVGTFSYEIRLYSTTVADDKGSTSGVSHTTGTKTHDFTGSLQPGQNYTWWVNATNSEGASSNESYWFTVNNTYSMTTEIDSNVTNVDQTNATLGQDVNISVNLTNTGTGTIEDISVQHTWLNCSCSDFNFTMVDTNLNLSNVTFYNDSCYLTLDIANITGGESYEYYMIINITGCAPGNTGNIRIYSNVTGEFMDPAQDYVDIAWGKNTSRLRITYSTEGADLTPVLNAAIIMLFVLVLVIVAALIMHRIGYFGNKQE